MNIDYLLNHFFWIFPAIVIGVFLLRIQKYGGFKGAMFGAAIKETLGEVTCSSYYGMSRTMRVHKLDSDDADKAIGLELISKSGLSYQMMPYTLSIAEAKQLTTLLTTAAR